MKKSVSKKSPEVREGTWDQLRLYPGALVKLVVEGKLEIVTYKPGHPTIYRKIGEW